MATSILSLPVVYYGFFAIKKAEETIHTPCLRSNSPPLFFGVIEELKYYKVPNFTISLDDLEYN